MVNLGVARGFIELNLQRLQQQRTVVINTARQMGDAYNKAFTSSAKAVQSLDRQLQSTNARLKSVQGELTAITAVGTALNVVGLKTADNARLIEARYRAITGSQEDALILMNQIADAARRTGLPVRQTQQDFAGLIPILRETGGDLQQYLSLVTRLSTLNPQEGTSGAIFAIREALSSGGTDLVSLSERFNIPRKSLRELIAETGNFGDALDIALDRLGATSELAEEVSRGLTGASARFRDAGQRALERGFTPFVDGAAKALDGLATAIENAPDGLVQLGAGASIAVTGIAATTLALSQLITSYQNLKQAGFFTGFADLARNPGVQRAGVTVGALAVGTGIGIGTTRAIGRATGNERLANFDLQQAGQIFKQALFLIVNALIEGGRLVGQAIGRIITAIQTIPQAFQIWRAQLEIAFADILKALEDARDFITPGNTRRQVGRVGADGIPVPTGSEALRAQGEARLLEAAGIQAAIQQRAEFEIDTAFDNLQLSAARAFGFIEDEATEATETLEETASTASTLADLIRTNQEKQNAAFLASLQERIAFEQQYAELLREGTPEQINDRIQALTDERAAIEQFLPELEKVAETSEEGAEQLATYRARLEEIDEQSARFGEAMIRASTKAIKALDTEFAGQVAQIEAEREKALSEAFGNLQKDLTELDADVLARSKELGAENIEALEEFQSAEREIITKHREKVLEIERKSREDILDAAARLDAAGVFSARKKREEQLSEANKELSEGRTVNAQRLAETQKNLQAEALELQAYYMTRRNELVMENQVEIAQLQAKFNAEIATATHAYNVERQQLNAHLQAQLQARRNAQAQEQSLLAQGFQVAQNLFSRFTNGIVSQLTGLQGASRSIGTQISAATRFVPPPIPTGSLANKPFAFQTGGVPSFAGNSAWAMVENKERILTPQQNANFERFVNLLSGSGAAGGSNLPSRIAIDVTGAETFEEMVEQTAMGVLRAVFHGQVAG